MSEPMFFTRHGRGLVADNSAALDALRRMRQGEAVEVSFKKPRNIQAHKLYWALCSKIADNSDRYPSAEAASLMLKVATGHADTYPLADGSGVAYLPRSISFAKMDGVEFSKFLDRCIHIVCVHIIPNLDETSLRRELEDMTGSRSAA